MSEVARYRVSSGLVSVLAKHPEIYKGLCLSAPVSRHKIYYAT